MLHRRSTALRSCESPARMMRLFLRWFRFASVPFSRAVITSFWEGGVGIQVVRWDVRRPGRGVEVVRLVKRWEKRLH